MFRPAAAHFRVVAWLIAVTTLFVAGGAQAHAMFTGSTPAANSILAESPKELRLQFSEPVTPISLALVDSNGQAVAGLSTPNRSETSVTATIPALAPGLYLVSFRVISEDAHPVAASFAFTVGAVAGDDTPAVGIAPEANTWRVPVYLSRALYVLSLLLAIGSALVLAWLRPNGSARELARRTAGVSAVAGIALALATLAIAGAEMTGGSASSLFHPDGWRFALTSTLGRSVGVAIVGLVIIGWSGFRSSPHRTGVALTAGAVAVAFSRALTGHPATTEPVALMMAAMSLHFFAAGFWFGALAPLHRAIKADSAPVAAAFLDRFSRVAIVLVSALLIIGAIMASVQVASVNAMIGTTYGRTLGLKLIGVVILIGLATINKQRHTPALARNVPGVADRLRRLISIELLVVIAVIAFSARVASTPPPRENAPGANSAAEFQALSGTIAHGNLRVTWQLDNARVLEFAMFRNDEPIELLEASVTFTPTGTGIEPLTLAALRIAPGRYRTDAASVALAGPWQLSIEALLTEFDKEFFETRLVIP